MSAGAPYREATRVRAFRASYWPEPEWTVLVALFSTLLAALCTLPLARRLTSLDAACAYENARPVCQIRTSGLLSTRTWTLSTIPATESGHGFAERAPADEVWSRFGDRGWKALGLGSLRGFGLRLARGCTEQIALSSSEAGGYFEVSAAAEALNRFFAVSGSTVSFHYGPWGAMPFALGAFAAVTGTLAMGIRRRGFEVVIHVDRAERRVVIERTFGPFHWKRRVLAGEDLQEARVDTDRDGSFVSLRCKSGRSIRADDRSSLRHGVHKKLVDELNAFLRKMRTEG